MCAGSWAIVDPALATLVYYEDETLSKAKVRRSTARMETFLNHLRAAGGRIQGRKRDDEGTTSVHGVCGGMGHMITVCADRMKVWHKVALESSRRQRQMA